MAAEDYAKFTLPCTMCVGGAVRQPVYSKSGYHVVAEEMAPCTWCGGTGKKPAIEILAQLAESEANMENVGEYGYGGEICDSYTITNWEGLIVAILDKFQEVEHGS